MVRYLFSVFCGLVILDIVLFIAVREYRNLLGVIGEDRASSIIIRLIPDILMVLFYSNFESYKRKHGYLSQKMVLAHGVIFSLLGLALCIPWIGMFLAPFSPIGSLYLSSILLFDNGYYISLGMAFVFVILNVYITWKAVYL